MINKCNYNMIINVINHMIGLIIISKKNNQTFRMMTTVLSLLSKVLQILVIEVKCKDL